MTEPSLALQATIRTRLIAAAPVTALVPAINIFDRNRRPEVFPCVVIGDGQSIFADNIDTFADRACADLHVWVQEDSLTGGKAIVGAIRDALQDGPSIVAGFLCTSLRVTGARFMRDKTGEYSHCIVSVEAILQ
jgi:hypothetical protein